LLDRAAEAGNIRFADHPTGCPSPQCGRLRSSRCGGFHHIKLNALRLRTLGQRKKKLDIQFAKLG
jgi:hypothetical protein